MVQLCETLHPIVLPAVQHDGKEGNQSDEGCAMWLLLFYILEILNMYLLFTSRLGLENCSLGSVFSKV